MPNDTPLSQQGETTREDFLNLVGPFYALVTLGPPMSPDGPLSLVMVAHTDKATFERAVERALREGSDYKFLRCEPIEYSLKLVGPGLAK